MTLDLAGYPMTNGAANHGGPAEKSRQGLNHGYKEARRYAQDQGLWCYVREFAYQEPWLAIALTFAIGYFAARVIRRAS